jgi:hypothetical protein
LTAVTEPDQGYSISFELSYCSRDFFIIAEKRWIRDSDQKKVSMGTIGVQALLSDITGERLNN